MLNSQWMQEQAGHLLARAEREAGQDLQAQAHRALELVLSRPPDATDVRELVDLVSRLKTKHQFSEQQARRAMCLAALNVNGFLYID
jgi:regulator of protease activity HflC (stomatin/prohibitin superfamily)